MADSTQRLGAKLLKKEYLIPIFTGLAVFAVFWPTIFYPFVGYDDNPYIILNPFLGQLDFGNFLSIWRDGGCAEENLYIPLTYVSYFFETGLFGKTALPIHLNNVLIHIANTLLVLYLAKGLRIGWGGAVVAALAFAIHPLQVEPVAWCMGRKDLLSTFFALIAILAYARYSTTWSPPSPKDMLNSRKNLESETTRDTRGKSITLVSVVLFGILAMLSKPVMITLPAVLLAYELCFSATKNGWRGLECGELKKLLRAHWRQFTAISALGVSALFVIGINLSGSFRTPIDASIPKLLMATFYALSEWVKRFFMLGTMEHLHVWPNNATLASPASICVVVCAAAFAGFIVHTSKYDRRVIFGLSLFIITFLPSIAHIRYADKFIMADRYTYFPLAGLFIAFAAFHDTLDGWKRRSLGVLCILTLPFMLVGARIAMESWSDSLHFWTLEYKTKPENPEMAYFAGLMNQERGQYATALKLYESCLKNDPKHARAYFATAGILFNTQKYRASLDYYEKALKCDSPYKADILANLAQTHVKLHQVDDAIRCYKQSLSIKNIPKNRVWLARLLLFKGKRDQARTEAKKAEEEGAALSADLKQAFPEIATGQKFSTTNKRE